ncbi:MAG: hypothetical protein ACPGED_10210, partial [Flavobacteriales bacterium]
MKNTLSTFIVIVLAATSSCNMNDNSKFDDLNSDSTMAVGMCSPIQLTFGETAVDFGDYILKTESIDSIMYQGLILEQEGSIARLKP